MALNLNPELLDAAKAIGLVNGAGDFDPSWFEHAFDRAQTILSNPQQRAALLSMLDRLAPPNNPPGTPASEKWHPLLGEQPRGNAYLTVRTAGSDTVLGVAGEVHGSASGGVPEGALRVHVPLLRFGSSSPQLAAGAAASPLALDLRVRVDLDRADGEPITLDAVRVSLRWACATSAGPSITIVLEGVGLSDGGTRDLALDPTDLGHGAIDLVSSLVKQLLPSTPAAAALTHLLGLIGLDEDAVPPLPFDQLTQGPAALQAWLKQIIDGGHLGTWLGHFGGIVGQPIATQGNANDLDDPLRVKLVAIAQNGAFDIGVAKADGRLHVSLGVRVAPDGASPPARLDARATLVAIPLAGTGSALALPRAHVLVTAPGAAGKLVNQPGTIVVDRLNAGVRWDGAAHSVLPTLELLNVTMGAAPTLPRVDLTHADSVADAAAAGLEAALTALLGGAGAPLLALAGLANPAGAPGTWPHRLNAQRLAAFAVSPTRTLGELHRAMVLDATHHWGFVLDELRRLIGLPGSVAGNGTAATPWEVPLASVSALTLGLAAWNETPGDPVVRLRIGLRARVQSSPWEMTWRADVLGFDIAADGAADVRLLGGQHAGVAVTSFPAIAGDAGLTADRLDAALHWRPDTGLRGQATLSNLLLRVGGTDLALGTLVLPNTLPFDLSVPASLPLPPAALQRAVSALVAQLLREALGDGGAVAGMLLGLHGQLPGLPTDWPTLFDPADALRLVSDPRAALRSYLDRLVQGAAVAPGAAASTAMPHVTRLLGWLQPWLQQTAALPLDAAAAARALSAPRGTGVHADPWCLTFDSGAGVPRAELLLWLDPDGAPPAWGTALAAAVGASGDPAAMLRAAAPLAALIGPLREALQGSSLDRVAAGLTGLANALEETDGLVPLDSQRVVHADWQLGATVPEVAHPLQPAHPQLIAQALDQLDTWQPNAAQRVILLLHPAFADRSCWDAFIAQAVLRDAAAAPGTPASRHVDLRVPNADPLMLDLSGTTGVSRVYTADLADDGSGNHVTLAQQIDRVAARLAQLRPGAQLFIVAHSTAGIAARQFAADHPGRVAGLVTIGTPHRGAPLDALRDPVLAQALRVAGRWLAQMPASPIRDALTQLHEALDGWRAGGSGALPVARVFPVGSFAPTASVATAGTPALALGSRLGGSPFAALRSGLQSLAAAAGGGGGALPTHLGVGLRVALGERLDGVAAARLHVRADLARFALRGGVAEPARPAQRLLATLSLEDPQGGYLVGAPQAHAAIGEPVIDVRVRALRLALTLTRSGSGAIAASLDAEALDAAFHSPTLPRLTLDDPLAGSVMGAAFDRVFNPAPAAGSFLAELGDALQAVGLLAVNAQQRIGLAADAVAALRADALGFLLPRVQTALERAQGWLGVHGSRATGFAWPLGALTLRARPQSGAWQFTLQLARELSGGGGRLPLAIAIDGGLSLGSASLAMRPAGSVSLTAGPLTLAADLGAGSLSVSAPPWIAAPFSLWPAPTPNAVRDLLNAQVPRLLLSTAVSRLLEALLRASGAPPVRVAALDALIADPVGFLTRPSALGSSSGSGGFLDGAKVNALLSAIARMLGQSGPAIDLPAGLRLSASGANAVTFQLATTAPLGGVLGLGATLAIDELMHATPGGTVTLNVPAAGPFPGLAVAFGVDGLGRVTLAVTPGGGSPIQLLPTFSGFGALLSGAVQSLLPTVLDAVDDALPASPVKTQTLAVAQALDLYDNGGGFAAHANQWRALLTNGSIASIAMAARTPFLGAARTLLNQLIGGTPFDIDAGRLRWTSPALPGVSGNLRVALGWDGSGPSFKVEAVNWRVDAAPLVIGFGGGFEGGQVAVIASLGADLSVISVSAVPALNFSAGVGGLALNLRPFGRENAAPLEIRLLPVPQVVATDALPEQIATTWLLPIAVKVIHEATKTHYATVLWTGGPTIRQVLTSAQILDGPGNLKPALPALPTLITGAVQGLLSTISLPVGELAVGASGDAGKLGVRLKGRLPIEIGDYKLTLFFGHRPSGPMSEPDAGLTVNLFNTAGFAFQPQLKARGIGLGFADRNDRPLVNTDIVRLGGVAAFAFFDVQLFGGFNTSRWGFEADLAGFGLPLGAAMGGGGGGDNPVAASLLQSSGGQGGNTQSVNPECDIVVRYLDGEGFSLTIGGQTGALWLTIQKQFGPIYIEQIGVQTFEGGRRVGLLLDGGVKISGLAVQVDDLTLLVPITKLGDASQWGIDLKGMAVSLESGTVKISGGLLKDNGPPVSYNGALMVDVAGRGFTAIGSYARPSDELGEYVSFFVFVSLPIPLGGPPYFFVLGLGGGVGINRALIVPTDMNQIPSFPLVAAIDNSGFANDPMGALRTMATNIPPKRGGFWLAAGLKFSTFVVVNTTAVVYVALDNGFELGLLGLSRMALPTEEFAIAQIELALKARFSTAEGLLSVQAQLTDRSYLLHPSCQLTGGFAFFLWFKTGKFVLTLGGYHKSFNKPPEFPDVPRLGFRWNVSDAVVIKGETYFALTTTCVMAGGRLEASFHGGPVKAWFKCWLDVLVSWDPFYYVFETGIEIGASVDTGIFGTIGVSLGATVHIEGPPVFGWVEVEIVIVTVRIEFGDPSHEIDYITDFGVFRDKYLTTGDPADKPVDVQVRAGLLPTNPPGADPAPGTADAPWVVGAEWAFDSETRLPANALLWDDAPRSVSSENGGRIDLAPMNRKNATSTHSLRIRAANGSVLPFVLDADRFVIEEAGAPFPEATWRWQDPRKMQAGAANIRRLGGIKLQGVAEIVNRSALVKIIGVVDDLPERALPLPFDQVIDSVYDALKAIGKTAGELVGISLGWTVDERRVASTTLLASPEFAVARKEAGAASGLSALAQRELRTRSAPARVMPLSTGLTMEPPAQEPPPPFADPAEAVARLAAPRLVAVMRLRGAPTSGEPLALRTSVRRVEAARVAPRMVAPRGKALLGARLHRAAPATVAAPTRAPQGDRTLLHPAFAPSGTAHADAFETASQLVMGNGVDLPAGTTQLWQLPETDEAGRARVRLNLAGDGASRVTWLDRSGDVIADTELPPADTLALPMPAGAAMVAVSCLGRLGGTLASVGGASFSAAVVQRRRGMADVSMALSPPGYPAAVGWQIDSTLALVGPQTLLARGASIEIATPLGKPGRGAVSAGLVRAGDAMKQQTHVSTRLPVGVEVVLLQLDEQDPSAADDGDLAIAADGATLSTPPVVVAAGSRRTLVYDVTPDEDGVKRGHVTISVASRSAWRVAGVVGLPGNAGEWGARLAGGTAPELIPPHALSADGEVSVRFSVLPAPVRRKRKKVPA